MLATFEDIKRDFRKGWNERSKKENKVLIYYFLSSFVISGFICFLFSFFSSFLVFFTLFCFVILFPFYFFMRNIIFQAARKGGSYDSYENKKEALSAIAHEIKKSYGAGFKVLFLTGFDTLYVEDEDTENSIDGDEDIKSYTDSEVKKAFLGYKYGGDIQVLLMKPNCDNMNIREKDVSKDIIYASEVRKTISFIQGLKGRNIPISHKEYTQMPLWKMFIFDDKVLLQAYTQGENSDKSPLFCFFRKENYSLYSSFRSFFSNKWSEKDEFELKAEEDLRRTIETMKSKNRQDKIYDIGIVIPLEEEFKVLFSFLKDSFDSEVDKDDNKYYYSFKKGEGRRSYRCVVTFMGKDKMDEKDAIMATKGILEKKPETLVLLGIAAGLSNDVKVGDVISVTQADSYLDKAKGVPRKKSVWEFWKNNGIPFDLELGGEVYKTVGEITQHVKNLEFSHSDIYTDWHNVCGKFLEEKLVKKKKKLTNKKIIGDTPSLHSGHIATGKIVGSCLEFGQWLKSERGDRNYLALEMESGGFLSATSDQVIPSKTLILRGVSDFGDERKKELDKIEDGVLRRYAMHNAVEFFFRLLDIEALSYKN